MSIDSQTMIVRSAGPVETTVGTEVVLMLLESGECLGLGETGSDVWRMIEQPIQVGTLVDSLGGIYKAPAGVIEQDVIELLEDMRERGLVELR